jgi:hypothetical protein
VLPSILSWTPEDCPTGPYFWISSALILVFHATTFLSICGVIAYMVAKVVQFVRDRVWYRWVPPLSERAAKVVDHVFGIGSGLAVIAAVALLFGIFLDSVAEGRTGSFYRAECEPICEERGLEVHSGTADECVCGSVVAKAPCVADFLPVEE